MMESTRLKALMPTRTLLIVAALLAFILLIYPALSVADWFQVIRPTDDDTIKIFNIGKTGILRLDCIDAQETSKMINRAVGPFCLNFVKNHSDWGLNKSVANNVDAMIDTAEF